MARQCHLDTCPTGIATQREDLRAKFAGTPEQVERFALALAEDLRRELAAIGASSVGEVIGEAASVLRPRRGASLDLRPVLASPRWMADVARRADPARAARVVRHAPASPLEERLVGALRGQGPLTATGLRLTTADRSFGAALSGALERGQVHGPIRIECAGSAGQSFGAFARAGIHLRLVGQANDYVAKGLSGGTVEIVPEPASGDAHRPGSLAGNTCLYGATGGRLHIVGRAGMRFAVRNAGAEAVVEGIGPHGAEYMTGGTLVVLGPVGANFGAGMTGGRAFLYDPAGRHAASLNVESVVARRVADVVAGVPSVAGERTDGSAHLADLLRLLAAHAEVGSALAAALLQDTGSLSADTWLVEPRPADRAPAEDVARPAAASVATAMTPDRNQGAPTSAPTDTGPDRTLEAQTAVATE
jgi:glutamate synthase domain-containing protein 3